MHETVLSSFKMYAEGLNVDNARLYSYEDLRIATEDFSPVNKIGKGGFGSVYKVILFVSYHPSSGNYFATGA